MSIMGTIMKYIDSAKYYLEEAQTLRFQGVSYFEHLNNLHGWSDSPVECLKSLCQQAHPYVLLTLTKESFYAERTEEEFKTWAKAWFEEDDDDIEWRYQDYLKEFPEYIARHQKLSNRTELLRFDHGEYTYVMLDLTDYSALVELMDADDGSLEGIFSNDTDLIKLQKKIQNYEGYLSAEHLAELGSFGMMRQADYPDDPYGWVLMTKDQKRIGVYLDEWNRMEK